MFIGEYALTIDDKGRLAVPKKFRDEMKKGMVVTRGIDNCLFVYPMSEWNKLAEKISQLPLSQKNTRAFARLMLAGAMDVSLDGQGRIILPDYLRAYAKTQKKVVIAGLLNRLEIWDEAAWNQYKKNTESKSEEISEQLGTLGVL